MAESVLILRQGVDGGFVWPIADAAGAPADLTGCTARCQVRVREDPAATLLAELTASVVGSTVVVQWTAEESLLWDWTSGYSDVLLIAPDGTPRQYIWQGILRLDKAVTHG